MKKELSEKIAFALGALCVLALIIAPNSILVMVLWNWLMPAIFGIKTITYFQAMGITWLAQILFKPSNSNKNS
jgi:hypothetical protein